MHCVSASFTEWTGRHEHIHLKNSCIYVNLPAGPLMWFTKITSSLSCSESGEELESLSISSESNSESSLILITPPTSTQCFGNFEGRLLGFPSEWQRIAFRKIHDAQKPTNLNPRDTIMLDTAQDHVTHVSSCLRRFSLFWVSVLGSVSELRTWKHPYRTKTHKSQSSSPTAMHNHRAIYTFYRVLWNTWFWLVYCDLWEISVLPHWRRQKLH